MKTISTIICLAAVVLVCINSSLGLNPPFHLGLGLAWGDDGSDAYDWYSSDAPSSPEGLSDEGLLSEGEETGGVWIVDSSGKEKRTALEIPMGAWARVMLAPSESGELKLYCPHGTQFRTTAHQNLSR